MQADVYTHQLLDRLIPEVNKSLGSSLISPHQCSVQKSSLSFYQNFRLCTLFDSSYIPLVKYNLLDNGKNAIYLDGSFQAWKDANQIEPPKISLSNILEYTKLVISTTSSNKMKCNITTSIEDIDFSKMPTDDMLQRIESAIKPPVISFKDNVYSILTCLLENNILYDSLITIQPNGDLEIVDKNFLLNDIPTDNPTW
ncbi:MAG: hypothetical protein AB7S48_04980 [Bacteroidales bacterium]